MEEFFYLCHIVVAGWFGVVASMRIRVGVGKSGGDLVFAVECDVLGRRRT